MQDSYGYVWMATQDGLNRYNGYEVSIFRHKINDPGSLSENFTLCLAEDANRNVWIGTNDGLNVLNRSTEIIQRFFQDSTSKISQPVSTILAVDSLRMLVILNNNLYLLNISQIRQRKELPNPVFKKVGSKAFVDEEKRIWFTTGDQLKAYDLKSASVVQSISCKQSVKDFYQSIDKILWLATDSGLYYLAPGMSNLNTFPNSNATLSRLKAFAAGEHEFEFWVGGDHGINVIRKKKGGWYQFRSVVHDPIDPEGLPVSQVFSMMRDLTGMTWIGTSHDGVYTRKRGGTLFSVFQHKHSEEPSLSSHINWSISQSRSGKYLIGSANGLNICQINTAKGLITDNKLITFYNSQGIPLSVFQVYELSDHEIIIGTNQGLFSCDPVSGKHKPFYLYGKEIKFKIMHINSDQQGRLWFATSNGAYMCQPGQNTLNSPTVFLPKFDTSLHSYVSRVFQDKQGRIWLGSMSGFTAINSKTGEPLLSLTDFVTKPDQHQRQVSTFQQDSLGRIWFATFGAGIYCIDEPTRRLTAYTEANGLSNNVVYSLLEDQEYNFWLSTNHGLMRFNPYKGNIVTYHNEDGLPIEEFNQNGFYKDRDGYLFFASTAGLVMKNHESKSHFSYPSPVILTSIDINYQRLSIQHPSRKGLPFEDMKTIELNYADKVIGLEFSAMDFRNSDRVSYAYKLEGFDKNWVKVPSERRYVTYSSLPYGTYTFKVRAAVEKELWNSKELSLVIHVNPPFWATWWFIGGVALSILGMGMGSIYFYSRQRLNRKNRELEVLKQVQEERERISRDLHDHVGAQITYMITKLDHIQFKAPTQEELLPRLEVISNQARSTMQLLRETIWAIRKEQVTIPEFVQKLKEYLSQMFTGFDHMTYELNAFEPLSDNTLKPIKALNTFRIIQEAVTNSTKYSGGTSVSIRISTTASLLIVEVSDNGKGFLNLSEESSSSHNGLENIRFRAEEMGAKLRLYNDHGAHIRLKVSIA